MKSIGRQKPRRFCDSADFSLNQQCEICPLDAECEKGVIIKCYNDKILKNHECIKNDEMLILKNQMMDYLEKYLAKVNGNN